MIQIAIVLVMNVTMTGTLVRFTSSKLEMFAIPATAIITALIGLSRRPTLAAFCMPRRIVVALPPRSAAKFGTSGAKAEHRCNARAHYYAETHDDTRHNNAYYVSRDGKALNSSNEFFYDA